MSDHDIISQFLAKMADCGCEPDSGVAIVADDKWHRYKVAGDKIANARYQLKIENGFGVGRFIYFKENTAHKFHSKSTRQISPEERQANQERLEREQREKDAQQAQEYAQVAKECQAIWESAVERDHPYLQRKQISPDGSRVADLIGHDGKIQKNVLLLPVWKNGEITSLQRIYPNGFKAFMEGGDVSGGYTAFASDNDDKSVIIICEGWATGKSIFEATGIATVIAYNAGNLLPVALEIRKKYPQARIIIAADNDQWTFNVKRRIKGLEPSKIPGNDQRWRQYMDQGRLWNPGLEKARQAAVKIGAHVIFPDIPSDDEEKRTDFNDLHHMSGLEAVKNRISAAIPAKAQQVRGEPDYDGLDDRFAPPFYDDYDHGRDYDPADREHAPISAYEDSQELQSLYDDKKPVPAEKNNQAWRAYLQRNDKGGVIGTSLNNARLILQNEPDYSGLFCYDEFTHEKVVSRCPPWEPDPAKFVPRALRDEDVTNLAMHMERYSIKLAIPNLYKVLTACIMSEIRNPAREYFSRLVWDKVPRLDTWLIEYLGCKNDDTEYLAAIGRKWLVAAVKRVFEPGCKFDHILILEGPQNIGKSSMLRELATIHGRAYFDDTIKAKDLPLDKTVPKLQGVLIIELSEMSGFKKMDNAEAKQIISTQYDRIVKKYANEPSMMPRQFVFAGTINPQEGYLDDPTGNRRYWPAYCTRILLDMLRRDKEQLWAEAVELYKAGEEVYLKGRLYKLAEEAVKNRGLIHPWQHEIEDLVSGRDGIAADDIWDKLQISDRTRRTKDNQEAISKIMTGLGYEYTRRRSADSHVDRPHAWYKMALTEQQKTEKKDEEIAWNTIQN